MRVEQTFWVSRRPEVVFEYMTDPTHLAAWQTSKTAVEQLTVGPPGLGTLIRERTRGPGGREFEQVVEFTEFDPPHRFRAHIVERPFLVDAVWELAAAPDGTLVRFHTDGGLTGAARLLQPLAWWLLGRRMARYHQNLRKIVEALPDT